MNPVLFATILIRVLGIYLVVQQVMHLAQNASMIFLSDQSFFSATDFKWILFAAYMFVPLLAGLVFWVLAPPLARLVVGKGSSADTVTPLSIGAATGAAISVVGLFVIATYLPALVSSFLWVYNSPASSTLTNADLGIISNALAVALGLALFLGVRNWVRLIARLRGFPPRE